MTLQYKTMYGDPPWDYRHRTTHGAVSYLTLSVRQLIEMGPQMRTLTAPNAHLYLWSTDVHLPDAFEVIQAWGFRYIQLITLFKNRAGLGFYFRHHTEQLLFAVRGKLRLLRRDLPSSFVEPRRKHSQKPSASYRLIEIASPGPRVELFARERREGWSAWGNEVESDITLDVPPLTEERSQCQTS